jgi:hypothetical protein
VTLLHSARSTGSAACLIPVCLVLMQGVVGNAPSAFGQDGSSGSANSEEIAADLFQFTPETPAELIQAARSTQLLDRTADARAFLRKVLDPPLPDDELRAARRELGPSIFLALRLDPRLSPEAEQLLRAVNLASRSGEPVSDAEPAKSQVVVEGKSVNELLELARDRILAADDPFAVRVGADARTVDEVFESDLQLVDAQRRLENANFDFSESLITREDLIAAKSNYLAALTTSSLPIQKSRLRRSGNLIGDARRYVTAALAIEPENEQAQTLALVADCALVPASLSPDITATVSAGKSSDQLLAALNDALELNHGPAAVELMRGLAAMSADDLDMDRAGRILQIALLNADVRVRQLAARYCARNPQLEVRQAAVEHALQMAKSGVLRAEAVVVTPDDSLLSNLQFALEEIGYAAAGAQTGPAGFDRAANQLNCDLVLVTTRPAVWPLPVLLANLRADVRTQNTPIVVFGNVEEEPRINELSRIYPGIWFIHHPVGLESLATKIQQLRLPASQLTLEDRAALKTLSE